MTKHNISDKRLAVLSTVAEAILQVSDGTSTTVAVDGVDGAGKTVFADELGAVLSARGREVVRISIDDFHRVRKVRYRRGRHSPESFWLDSFDYDQFVRVVIEPFRSGPPATFSRAVHDLATDMPIDAAPERVPDSAILVVDGIFLHRKELAEYWDYSIFLNVDFEVSIPRMAKRDGGPHDMDDPLNQRYVEGERIYLESCTPEDRATVVIDNNDYDTPRITRITR